MNVIVKNKLTNISRILVLITSVLLVASIFVPLWQIDLDAPQYPEGLNLLIYSNKLGGNVDIINGLNHYIGMKTLHAEDFIEFTLLPYIIGFFALFALLTTIFSNKKLLYVLFTSFALFGVIAMIDFWRWEYNYGHNLDPNAAIIVPGMAYQPPLIGFKQLLNFGAYSMPSFGGWFFILSGAFLLIAVLLETGVLNKFIKNKTVVSSLFLFTALSFTACTNNEPQPVKLNTDMCDFCKMTIADSRFFAELVTDKGRAYKFDDLVCMRQYVIENEKMKGSTFYVCDYTLSGVLIPAKTAFFVKDESVKSPMGGNTAAFRKQQTAKDFAAKVNSISFDWEAIKF